MLPDPASRQRVLVVDDDDKGRSVMATVLERSFSVTTASDAHEARERLEAEPFDVVLSDHRMPDETGLSLLRWVATRFPDTVRILVTGFPDAPLILDAFHQGHIWQLVAKPWNRELLLQLIDRGLEYRSSQRALQQAEQRYRDLFQNAPVGLMRAQADGTIEEANRAVAATLGFEEVDTLIGARLARFMGDVAWTALLDELDREHVVRRREVVLTSESGRPVHVLLDAAVRAESDGLLVIDLSTLDLSAERSAREETVALEKQLLRLQKHGAIESFAGGLAHDFNNFISIINTSVGFAGLVLRDHPDAEWKAELEGCLADIEHASAEGAALAQQLLTMVREGGTERAALDVNSISERVVRLLRRGYHDAPPLSTELQPDLPLVYANASQLHQCILNLCLNGLEAMTDGGELRVITSADADTVCITVEDDGTGIPDAVRAQVFDPYFTTKGGDGGTGLGLSVVRAIVAQHAGEIRVDSKLGEGSRFTVHLPTAAALERREATLEHVEGAPLVLLVDHEPALGNRVARSLERLGYRVRTESDGRAALARVEAEPDDVALVMLDVALSDAGGAELVRSLRARAPELPIVIATTSGQDAELCQVLDVEVLEKPYRIEQVAEVVQRASR